MEIKVEKNFFRSSPRKVRLVVNLLRGMSIEKARVQLKFLQKDCGTKIYELLKSGVFAAKEKGADLDKCFIKTIYCNEGPRLKRRRICERGKSTTINKKMSHLTIIISDNKNEVNNGSKSQPK